MYAPLSFTRLIFTLPLIPRVAGYVENIGNKRANNMYYIPGGPKTVHFD